MSRTSDLSSAQHLRCGWNAAKIISAIRSVSERYTMKRKKQQMASTTSILITLNNQEEEEEDRIVVNLESGGYGDEADQYSYSISLNTPLRCLMLDFVKRVGVTFNTVRFRHRGRGIHPRFPPKKLEMEDGDTIKVIAYKEFRSINGATQSALITLPLVADGEKRVILELKNVYGHSLHYSIGRNTPFRNMLLEYADRICEFYEDIKFLTDAGRYIDCGKTADELGCKGSDLILVLIAQYG